MTKVLRIINRFNLGGISYNVSYLSKYLPNKYETLLIGGPEEEGEESSLFIPHSLELKPEIIYELRRSINPFGDYFAYRKIKKIIKEFKPDIVHTHASKAGAIGRLAAFHCKVPILVHTFHGHVFHGYFGSFKTGIFKYIERYLAKKSTAIVAISAVQKKELCDLHKICDANKMVVIPLGFDLNRFMESKNEKRLTFRTKYFLGEDEIAIGIIGRLAPIKNHYLFIDAIEYVVKNTSKKIKAFIIGDGETKQELMTYIQEKGLHYSINPHEKALFVFTSWIKEVDVALAGVDLVCLTSKNEGTPVSLIEAQAASKFIITTNVGGIQDILHPECGLLSDANDAEGYKNNLLYAVNHFEEVNSKAGAASSEVINKFSYSRLCMDMDELYTKLSS
ncbi:glycosyltransferase [Aurantibacillus circumpalustris]|uniref:glycosyltransferase n=1 Tax=Aurantibacillus circumpalustris TaxID=3036359 RepID=UPI00295AEB8D|nr:glycosyltransferase [Aurantibacillus circumpalustris]